MAGIDAPGESALATWHGSLRPTLIVAKRRSLCFFPEAKNGVTLDDVGRHAPTAAPRDGSKLALMIHSRRFVSRCSPRNRRFASQDYVRILTCLGSQLRLPSCPAVKAVEV